MLLLALKMEEGATNQGMQVASRTAVPNLFDTKDQFQERQFFHGWGGGGWDGVARAMPDLMP